MFLAKDILFIPNMWLVNSILLKLQKIASKKFISYLLHYVVRGNIICLVLELKGTHQGSILHSVDTSNNSNQLYNKCSVSIIRKTCLAQMAFSCPAPLGPGRRKGDQLAGRRMKIASMVERQHGGWRYMGSFALLYSVLSNRDKGERECKEVIHWCHWSGQDFLFGWQNLRKCQCSNLGDGGVSWHCGRVLLLLQHSSRGWHLRKQCALKWIYGIGGLFEKLSEKHVARWLVPTGPHGRAMTYH